MCYKQYILFFRPAFILGVWNWYLLGRGCLRDQSWIKALGTESLMSCVVIPVAGGTKQVLCDGLGRGLWKLASAFFRI